MSTSSFIFRVTGDWRAAETKALRPDSEVPHWELFYLRVQPVPRPTPACLGSVQCKTWEGLSGSALFFGCSELLDGNLERSTPGNYIR